MPENERKMHTQSVEIHVTAGPARGRSFVFEKSGHLIFGRAPDAHISVPDDQYISRRHFELSINPPTCIFRDLGSINGVFINGVHYGGPPSGQDDSSPQPPANELVLDDGDEIVVRETRITIAIRPTSGPEPATSIIAHTQGSVQDREVALLVLTIPQSLHNASPQSETLFSSLIGAILTRIKRHPASQALLFLKYLEKGLLMAFSTMADAGDLAQDLLESPAHSNEPIRMALHWGVVRTRPNGDIFGREVHRVYRIEGVRIPESEPDGSKSDYLLITQQGLAQLPDAEQRTFRSAGRFQLEGFDDPCELWILTKNEKG